MNVKTGKLLIVAISVSPAFVAAQVCPRGGYQPYDPTSLTQNLFEGAGNTKVTKDCKYEIGGQGVSGTESYCNPRDWLDRIVQLRYNGERVTNGAYFTGNGAPTTISMPDSNTVRITQAGGAVANTAMDFTFTNSQNAVEFQGFLQSILVVGDPALWKTKTGLKCGNGPFCYNLEANVFGATNAFYIRVPEVIAGSIVRPYHEFRIAGSDVFDNKGPESNGAWLTPIKWVNKAAELFGSTGVSPSDYDKKITCGRKPNTGTGTKNGFPTAKLTGQGISGSIDWTFPNEATRDAFKDFLAAVKDAELFTICPPVASKAVCVEKS
mmetsp:Transcript_31514/g.57055  ORF Transcript_31514/g.57055 Transcript_31514/m.57055 type:complete len:323 (-) Transcript_31514:190-1158(-)|eukprot:CAMPEP_0202487054 /NCGR_PEP_ID=MMETSP1361-20130828/5479_1 /ASSEMBLY_ACC=CAM_ASM_000849 /TAXON_ID=210615 /ORGANISM="Staurosira complex sp., Strain CCMP2646" /LENGTH=322 /DNA_ID=CAMNT_0049116355 /DNA_START=160 /DNA_END=1128 /DNA_ORIENTATION=+